MTVSKWTKYILERLGVTYALVDEQGVISECGENFSLWLMGEEVPLVGHFLTDVVPEFFGMEAEFKRVRAGLSSTWSLENIHRQQESGSSLYLTFTVALCIEDPTLMLILVKDVTEQGVYLQQLMQSRNETQLLRRKVNKLNAQLNSLLRSYVDRQIVEGLLDGRIRSNLGGDLHDVTVLFIDARGYTSLAEQYPPIRILELLNEYLAIIISVIDAHGGSVNQFAGDGVMALFNIHDDSPDHARLAVQAGIALQRTLFSYRTHRRDELLLEFGIGINTGPAIVGNVGAQWYHTYTAVGDTTNLAARITAITPAYSVWMSRTTYEALQGQIKARPLPAFRFKGKRAPTQLYEPYGIELKM